MCYGIRRTGELPWHRATDSPPRPGPLILEQRPPRFRGRRESLLLNRSGEAAPGPGELQNKKSPIRGWPGRGAQAKCRSCTSGSEVGSGKTPTRQTIVMQGFWRVTMACQYDDPPLVLRSASKNTGLKPPTARGGQGLGLCVTQRSRVG